MRLYATNNKLLYIMLDYPKKIGIERYFLQSSSTPWLNIYLWFWTIRYYGRDIPNRVRLK